MVQFNKLRIAGFKSFVEPSELSIEPGLTGVVGPNGCGKSNLIDALRWVMAETSVKEMRGGEMDDVIFGGTATRPSRNLAEVTLVLDNADRSAPAAFNEEETIEVTRRIERGEGSMYRVNGRDVRQRDVSLLFADTASGARSTAIVTQGRVGSLVAARPQDRRALLEEAAGITGLHNRRHEAELRLRAAETNLQRLEDILVALDGQLDGLKKQARQASRYRNLSDHIRRAEAGLLHRRWREASAAAEEARTAHAETMTRVADTTATAAGATTARETAAAALPTLRAALVAAQAEHRRFEVEIDGLAAEEARLAAQQEELERRHAQIAADRERERALEGDARAASERLGEEGAGLAEAQGAERAEIAAAESAAAAVRARVEDADAALTTLTAELAQADARRSELAKRVAEARERASRLAARAEEGDREIAVLEAASATEGALATAEAAQVDARRALMDAEARAGELDADRAQRESEDAEMREAMQSAEGARAKLDAERRALGELLSAGEQDMWPPIIDRVTVDAGYETALGAALADDLLAPADVGAAVHWRTPPATATAPALPAGATPLASVVRGPAALERRLAQIGLVPDAQTGAALAENLAQGQRLVSRDGGLWRWDGFTIRAGTMTAAATRLAQRNRLAELRAILAEADGRLSDARARAAQARERHLAAQEAARAAQHHARACRPALDDAREHWGALARQDAERRTRRQALADAAAQLAADRAESEARAGEAEAELVALGDGAAARAMVEPRRAFAAQCRAQLLDEQSRLDRAQRDAEGRLRRLADIGRESESWTARAEGAALRLVELEARWNGVEADLARLAGMPADIAGRRHALADLLADAGAARAGAGDALANAETSLAERERALKQAEAELGAAREDRVRAEAQVRQCEQTVAVIVERIGERLHCAPEGALALAETADETELADTAHLEGRLDRLLRERDNMGAVNLRAEEEAAELGEKIESMRRERDDLTGAIGRLREGIAELNREGRERLLASFEAVNGHFQVLFSRLFDGGQARLMLTDQDNPLEAGLEIMASPPGKRLQVLSLLSGGERALTALALLFAVFLTNPAPICVLDEVDAPLDDANVDRICSLLEEIAHTSQTRFLVITHHRMTMARMDRLFGVTMPEPGISQLVSVDLARAEELRQIA